MPESTKSPAEVLETHGIEPKGAPEWKLFEIDGWQLLAQPDENDDGDGWGIRYSTAVSDEAIGVVYIWLGNSKENERTAALFDKTFAEMDEDKARKALQILLDQVGPIIGRQASIRGDAA